LLDLWSDQQESRPSFAGLGVARLMGNLYLTHHSNLGFTCCATSTAISSPRDRFGLDAVGMSVMTRVAGKSHPKSPTPVTIKPEWSLQT